tara:strand:+ start:855 stop:1526 length:672 start_codon:yes stop_codon:yes gene_type:complete
MREKILFCGYRDWSLEMFRNVVASDQEFLLAQNSKELKEKLETNDIKTILFIGWSWIIKDDILDKYNCICLHPSPLPKYRGGCPVQHQILNNESDSAVTLFLMDDKVDHGPVLWQRKFSLDGPLSAVFMHISVLGTEGIFSILETYKEKGNFDWGTPQDHDAATYYRRRKPEESEIKPEDLASYSAKEIYNKIRALQNPYPNAFIVCKDGTKLYLTEANYDRD